MVMALAYVRKVLGTYQDVSAAVVWKVALTQVIVHLILLQLCTYEKCKTRDYENYLCCRRLPYLLLQYGVP